MHARRVTTQGYTGGMNFEKVITEVTAELDAQNIRHAYDSRKRGRNKADN